MADAPEENALFSSFPAQLRLEGVPDVPRNTIGRADVHGPVLARAWGAEKVEILNPLTPVQGTHFLGKVNDLLRSLQYAGNEPSKRALFLYHYAPENDPALNRTLTPNKDSDPHW